ICMSPESLETTKNTHMRNVAFWLTISLLPSLIINKRFEQEADRFACEKMGKATGIISFFTRIQNIEKEQDKEYERTKDMINQNKESFGSFLHGRFMGSYYAAKCSHLVNKGLKWLYHNTPLGAHPSPAERVKAAEEYIKAATPA
ncbi:MAG: hypothetical protein WCE21_03610, partial [Candidatus Babeliales bacterium]